MVSCSLWRGLGCFCNCIILLFQFILLLYQLIIIIYLFDISATLGLTNSLGLFLIILLFYYYHFIIIVATDCSRNNCFISLSNISLACSIEVGVVSVIGGVLLTLSDIYRLNVFYN